MFVNSNLNKFSQVLQVIFLGHQNVISIEEGLRLQADSLAHMRRNLSSPSRQTWSSVEFRPRCQWSRSLSEDRNVIWTFWGEAPGGTSLVLPELGCIRTITVNCWKIEDVHMMVVGNTKRAAYVWLKFVTHSRANSRCWVWSSPTGTCVALCTKISAACRTGYENNPSLSFDLLPPSRGDASFFSDSLLY